MEDIEMSLDENGAFSMFQPTDVIEQTTLDYEREFGEDADFLRDKKKRISHRHRNTWFEDAQDIKEVHDRLATHGRESTFSTWLADLEEPITIRKAQRYILRLNFITTNRRDKKDYLLSLPVSVVDEAAAPSASQELKDGVLNGTVKNLKQVNEIKYGAKESSKVAELENRIKELESKNAQAEKDRDEAKNELGAMRVSKGNIEAALDKTNADRAKDRETIAQLEVENERLRNQPQAEPEIRVVEKRIEVIPDDYNTLKRNCAYLEKQNAELTAHQQGMSLQELAESDEEFAKHMKSMDEESEAAKKVSDALYRLDLLPDNEYEMREFGRCYLDRSIMRDDTLKHASNSIERAIKKLELLADVICYGQKLKVVK